MTFAITTLALLLAGLANGEPPKSKLSEPAFCVYGNWRFETAADGRTIIIRDKVCYRNVE